MDECRTPRTAVSRSGASVAEKLLCKRLINSVPLVSEKTLAA